jgi:hypothetical protein
MTTNYLSWNKVDYTCNNQQQTISKYYSFCFLRTYTTRNENENDDVGDDYADDDDDNKCHYED